MTELTCHSVWNYSRGSASGPQVSVHTTYFRKTVVFLYRRPLWRSDALLLWTCTSDVLVTYYLYTYRYMTCGRSIIELEFTGKLLQVI